jgi:hypothetical protein
MRRDIKQKCGYLLEQFNDFRYCMSRGVNVKVSVNSSWLTDSMSLSPSWEAASRSATLWKPKIHDLVYNILQ